MSVVHLHCHDEYSFDAVGTSKHFAKRAADMGQPALAKTNHGTLSGVIHHIDACVEQGILPIIGNEVYYRPHRKVQRQKELRYAYFHMTLLAANATGWKNLMYMSSEAGISGFYEKPCLDFDLLKDHSEGIICGLGCLRGVLCKFIEDGDSTAAHGWVRQLKNLFGDRLFGEIMPSALEAQVSRNIDIVSVCHDESVMVCSTIDAHAPEKSWVPTQDVRLMIGTNQTVDKREAKRKEGVEVFEFKDDTYYLQSKEEIADNFSKNHPGISKGVADESINNTLVVASMVSPWLIGKEDKLPRFKRDRPDIEILRDLVFEGLTKIGHRHDPVYEQRANSELEQIQRSGFDPYFLQVRDVVEWALSDRGMPDENGVEEYRQKEPIEVGPGRGSAGGSLVSYTIGITNMDPIAYRLKFERFLNIDRKGMPDIDIDFPQESIDLVEEYTKKKFGKENVIDVIAHSTFGPRAAIRDVGRVLGLEHKDMDTACKSIDITERGLLEDLRKINPLVEGVAEKYPEAWVHMCRLQGQINRMSEHAAALVVTPPETPAIDVIPLERKGGMNGKMITAWGERAGKGNSILSDYGFMKFDWLRVAELDKQAYAVKLIREQTGDEIILRDLPMHQDPYAVDEDVMAGFGKGLLAGIFQFSATAAKLTKRVKPTSIFDLAAINALIRPGPRGSGDDVEFVDRKNGHREVTYWHPKLEPFLDYTQGVMVFQEQLVEVVHQLGGLEPREADNFRKIASKLYRDPEYARSEMTKWKNRIGNAFVANGIPAEKFEEIMWPNFLSFSDYSFNLAHAAGYALLAARDMYLKIRYPHAFYAALLSKGLSAIKDLRQWQKEVAVREARAIGVKVLPPDINDSDRDYVITSDGIRLGLESIKNVGPVATKNIIKNKPYRSFAQFEEKLEPSEANKSVKAALICSGAFDSFGMRDDYSDERIDELEREFLGISLTSPYAATNYADVLEPRITKEEEFDLLPDGTIVTVGGEVINIKEWTDRKKQKMCFVDLAYGVDEWSVTFFAHHYKFYKDLLESRRPVIIAGKKNTHEGRSGIVPLNPEQCFDPEGLPLMEQREDGLHEKWTHYVQDVHELALQVRDKEPVAA